MMTVHVIVMFLYQAQSWKHNDIDNVHKQSAMLLLLLVFKNKNKKLKELNISFI